MLEVQKEDNGAGWGVQLLQQLGRHIKAQLGRDEFGQHTALHATALVLLARLLMEHACQLVHLPTQRTSVNHSFWPLRELFLKWAQANKIY